MRVRTSVLVAALACASVSASAQTFNPLDRVGSPRAMDLGAGGVVLPSQNIGLRDCLSSEFWTFTVDYVAPSTLALAPPISLQYWAGISASSCPNATTSDAGTVNECWELAEPVSVTSAPLSGMYQVSIPTRYIVDPVNGNCNAPVTNGGMPGTAVSYLSLLGAPPAGTAPTLLGTPFGIQYNTVPPVAPADVVATAEDAEVQLTWTYSGDALTADGGEPAANGIAGFWLLCDPDPHTVGDGGAILEDAIEQDVDIADGVVIANPDGGATAPASCGTPGLLAMDTNNTTPDFGGYLCPGQTGMISATATSVAILGLTNTLQYRFAVVAEDGAGNRSPVAVSENCAIPEPLISFWDEYRLDGGQALPGYCTAQPWYGGRASALPWSVLGLLAVIGGVRRARRRNPGR